jgi:2'-phosphotransferase
LFSLLFFCLIPFYRPDGYITLEQIRCVRGFEALTYELARSIVHEDNKMRFSLIQDQNDWWIRANQGHTIDGIDENQLLTRINHPSEIPIAVHGTYYISWASIKTNGLSKMDRNHIHFAVGLPDQSGVISGMRKSAELLIYIDVSKAMESGAVFFKSTNGVILTSGIGDTGCIPSDCFQKVVDMKSGKVIYGDGMASENADEDILRYSNSQPPLMNQKPIGFGKGKEKGKGKGGPMKGGGGGGGGPMIGGGPPMKGMPSVPQQRKWPEYVGQSGESAANDLRSKFSQYKVVVVKVGSMVTMDHDLNRIRVFINPDGTVAKPPKLG